MSSRFFTNHETSTRNFMVGLAERGLAPERTANYGKKELKAFADSLDRLLSRLIREESRRGAGGVSYGEGVVGETFASPY